jgi:hypothetical protein
MPPRLNHRKSRAGCRRCKQRRVKCDEAHPVCGHCERHGVPCEWGGSFERRRTPPKESKLSTALPIKAASPTGLESPYSVEADLEDEILQESEERRMVELQLLHHFTSTVTNTFPSNCYALLRKVMRGMCIDLAFQHPMLMNTILSLSALHLSREYQAHNVNFSVNNNSLNDINSERKHIRGRHSISTLHRVYLNVAVRQQREALADVGSHNAEALFMSSVFMSYLAIGLIKKDSVDEYGPPAHWLRMVRGIQQISFMVGDKFSTPVLISWINEEGKDPDFRDYKTMFDPQLRTPFEGLLDWVNFPEQEDDPDTRAMYEATLSYIGGMYKGIQSKEPIQSTFRRVISMGLIVPPAFHTYIDERRPRALVMLAYYSSMTAVLNDHWAFHGWGEREVNGLQNLIPPAWQCFMEWPKAMLLSCST